MSMNESVSYLKGLAEGLDIDKSTKEGKLLTAMIDVLSDMAEELGDVEEVYDELSELVDDIDEDLGELEDDFYGEDEEDDDGEIYEVTCPNCGETLRMDESVVMSGDIECPNCGQKMELDLDCCDDEDCDCEDCKH